MYSIARMCFSKVEPETPEQVNQSEKHITGLDSGFGIIKVRQHRNVRRIRNI